MAGFAAGFIGCIRSRFESLMQDSIQISHLEGSSAYGPVYGSPVTETWKMGSIVKGTISVKGEEITATSPSIGPHDSVAAVGDKMVWNGQAYEVTNIKQIRWFGLVGHVEGYFQEMPA